MIDHINANELNAWKKADNVYLVDVREKDEFESAHIDGAHLIPLSQFHPTSIPMQSKPLVIYCRSGGRSQRACELLVQAGYQNPVYNLDGGILSWMKQGFPTN